MPGHGSSQGGSDGPMHELEHFAVVCKRKQAMSSRESPLRGRAATLGDASTVFWEAGGCAGTGTPQSRRKRPWLERPFRQELNSLRAEVEQLRALLKAPDPTPAFQAAAAWESGEDLEDDGISVRSSKSEFQSLEDQGDPFPDPQGREVDPPSNYFGSLGQGRPGQCTRSASHSKPIFSLDSGCPSIRGPTITGLLGRGAAVPKVLPPGYVNTAIELGAYCPPLFQSEEQRLANTLCPVRALQLSMVATGAIRQSDQLFVCHGGQNRGRAL
ncbi:hypothetical protein GOODEAATRI_030947 [Goodea atripinnis]|uniref:Uncharacterized protein n=1 Tax=Goodea atripinnis TaxID=208336 RepID=A0ABV0NZD0_9TELE